jgi:ethanolamine utilization protein EutP (predicted NTPase)
MSSDAEIQAAWEQTREWVEKFGAEPVFILNHAEDSGLPKKPKLPKHHRSRRSRPSSA